MSNSRSMDLNAVIVALGSHEAGWRMPESDCPATDQPPARSCSNNPRR
jgi:methenyltetrahydromethanopterin cyclohydrolase